MKNILAIDQSLTSSGICLLREGGHESLSLTPENITGVPRLQWIVTKFRALLDTYTPNVIVMEGYSFGSNQSRSHALGELGGVLRLTVNAFNRDFPTTLYVVPPTSLKKFTTGKGNSKKQEVLLNIYKRWGIEFSDDNQADAFALAMFASQLHYGEVPNPHKGSITNTMREAVSGAVAETLGFIGLPVRNRTRRV